MSEHLSLKEVKANALRLMDEWKYYQALQNWLYIKKNMDSIDPQVLLQIGRWHEQLDSAEEASKAYRQAIKIQAEDKHNIDNKIFLESLFGLGQIEFKREDFKSAYDAYESFAAFVSKNSIKIQDETNEYVKEQMELCLKSIDERVRNVRSDGVKNLPYASSGTNAK